MEQALALSEARDGPAESELAGGESAPSADELSPSSLDKVKHKDEKDRLKEMDKKEADKKSDKDTEKEKVKGAEGASLESLLQRLPGCVSRDLIDQLTVRNRYPQLSGSDCMRLGFFVCESTFVDDTRSWTTHQRKNWKSTSVRPGYFLQLQPLTYMLHFDLL